MGNTKHEFGKPAAAQESFDTGLGIKAELDTSNTNSDQEAAVHAIDDRASRYKRLQQFTRDNRVLFQQFVRLCAEVEELDATVKALVGDIQPAGAFRHGCVLRKEPGVKRVYDPTLLPGDLLTWPGVVKALDPKKITELISGQLAGRATEFAKALRTDILKSSIVVSDKVPATKLIVALLKE
tara:strand:+ start:912 stop:1457 length:546 start_codon:yes stop_codon:yes gene_type:complete